MCFVFAVTSRREGSILTYIVLRCLSYLVRTNVKIIEVVSFSQLLFFALIVVFYSLAPLPQPDLKHKMLYIIYPYSAPFVCLVGEQDDNLASVGSGDV